MDGKRYFSAKENYAKFLPLSSVSKLEAFLARPRSGKLAFFFYFGRQNLVIYNVLSRI